MSEITNSFINKSKICNITLLCLVKSSVCNNWTSPFPKQETRLNEQMIEGKNKQMNEGTNKQTNE